MVATSSQRCSACGAEFGAAEPRCPNCHRASPQSSRVRVVGVLLIVIGLGLSGGMAYLIWIVSSVMRGASSSGAKFTGTPRDAALILALLGAVLVFGLASVAAGLWQAVFGRRNKGLAAAVLLVGLAVVGLAVWSTATM